MRSVGYRRLIAVLLGAAVVIVGLIGTYSYGDAYWQHRGFAPVRRLPHARIGRLLTVHFYSTALHRRSDYLVYLPPGYSNAHRYPVYYLLHGAPGSPRDFISVVDLDVRLSNRLSEHEMRPIILVMPDGRINGDPFSDSEWANTPAGDYESYVLDVVRDVDARFATVPSRTARVIAGYSAGAYGALNIALHHLAVFANVQSWSGYFLETLKTSRVFAHASRAVLFYNSPLEFAQTLRPALLKRYPLRVYMFTGRSDRDGVTISEMAAVLRRVGADASFNLYPGGHDWQVWYGRVDSMMLLASWMVGDPPAAVHASGTRGAEAARMWTPARRPALEPPPLAAARELHALLGRGAWSGWRPQPAAKHGLGVFTLLGLLLAVASAALINLGFLLQQRGLVRGHGRGLRAWVDALRSRAWLGGQALGWLGFGIQVLAVALAPLALVQTFAAGGLALSVPLAAGLFGQRVPQLQLIAVGIIASGLALLPLGVPAPSGAVQASAMIVLSAGCLAAGAVTASRGGPTAHAIAAGFFYGVADAAIKAVALGVQSTGSAALLSGWTFLALGATFAGFVAFQASLRQGNAVSAISLMTALTTLTALLAGLAAFHESLGSAPAMTILHLLAIALVLACVPLLAGAEIDAPSRWRTARSVGRDALTQLSRGAAASTAACIAAIVAVCSGTGLLYGLRGLGWLSIGPRLGDALPLLQLARFDGQPAARVAAAWLVTGAVLGWVLIRIRPRSRMVVVGALGLLLVLFASEACFALARNLRLSAVLSERLPGEGAWAEGLLLAFGAALPGARLLQFRERAPAVLAATVRPHAELHRLGGGLPDSRGGSRPRHADAAGA